MDRKITYTDVVEYSKDYVKLKNNRVVTRDDIRNYSTNHKCFFGSVNKGNWCRCKQCRVIKYYLSKAYYLYLADTTEYDARLVR